ncbi:MAG: hypothetical protein IT506_08740 [Aquabacterium sp.]|nr:hypothetical protein [Aquabacterium sp.]
MSTSRPFPAHVPTLTEVVEETPIPESSVSDAGAVVTDFVAADVPAVLSESPLAHDIAVLTEVVAEGEALPSVDALLDAPDLSDAGMVVAAAESHDLVSDLGENLTDQITENLSASLAPMLESLADQFLRDMQQELNQRLRQMVAQAVAQELTKRRSS